MTHAEIDWSEEQRQLDKSVAHLDQVAKERHIGNYNEPPKDELSTILDEHYDKYGFAYADPPWFHGYAVPVLLTVIGIVSLITVVVVATHH